MMTNGKTRLSALLAAVVVSSSLSGCVIQSNSSSNHCASVQLSWAINEISTDLPLRCEEVPADTVVLSLSGVDYSFPCNAYAGVSPPVRPGTYSARVGLFDQGGPVSDTGTMSITLPGCGTFDLNANMPVVFDVN